jgi:hypothetical protein
MLDHRLQLSNSNYNFLTISLATVGNACEAMMNG